MRINSKKSKKTEIRVTEAKIKFLQQKLRNLKEDYDDEDDYGIGEYILGVVEKGRVDVIPSFVDDAEPNSFTPLDADLDFNRLVFDTPDGKLVIRAAGFFEDEDCNDVSTATIAGKTLRLIEYEDDYAVFANGKYLLFFNIENAGGPERVGAFLYYRHTVPSYILRQLGI